MSFDVRADETIRAVILADWRARYQARGYDLDIARNSDAYAWADAFAFQVEGLEGKAQQLTRELFPDTATTAFLERHAAVIGFTRKPATRASFAVTVTGAGSYTTSDVLVDSAGTRFSPVGAGSLPGPILVEARTAGTAGNLPDGTPLTWSPAPSGIDAAATVAGALSVTAVDIETDAALAQRILAYWRERPGGGNRADWVTWGEDYDGVDRAFVYPLRHGTLGDGTLGAVTLCVLAPAPNAETLGDPAEASTRLASGGLLSDLHDQLVGEGAYEEDGGLAPGTISPDDVFVVTGTAVPTNITLQLTMSSAAPFPFVGGLAFTLGTTTQVTVASLPTGLVAGVLIAVPNTSVRGGFAYRTVASVTGSGPYVITFSAVNSPATAASTLYPLPPNAADIRAAVISVIDNLGPGLGADPSRRFPDEDELQPPGTLYRGTIAAAVMGVRGLAGSPAGVNGVLNADVTAPASNVMAAAEELITLGLLTLIEA